MHLSVISGGETMESIHIIFQSARYTPEHSVQSILEDLEKHLAQKLNLVKAIYQCDVGKTSTLDPIKLSFSLASQGVTPHAAVLFITGATTDSTNTPLTAGPSIDQELIKMVFANVESGDESDGPDVIPGTRVESSISTANTAQPMVCQKCSGSFSLDEPIDDPTEWMCPGCTRKTIVTTRRRPEPVSKKSRHLKICTAVPPHHVGAIPGVEVGQSWKFRAECAESGVHRPPMAGIAGNVTTGCPSIVLSGGYADSSDSGETFVYTGCGGRKSSERGSRCASVQHFDQTLTHQNAALAMTMYGEGLKPVNELNPDGDVAADWRQSRPIRVVRGASKGKAKNSFAPKEGFRYDGLYKLVKYWHQPGEHGYKVYQFQMRRDDQSPAPWTAEGMANAAHLQMIFPAGNEGEEEEEVDVQAGVKRKRTRAANCTKKHKPAFEPRTELRVLLHLDIKNDQKWTDLLQRSSSLNEFVEEFIRGFQCPVCSSMVTQPVTLACGDSICKACLNKSIETNGFKCPSCWDFFAEEQSAVNADLQAIFDYFTYSE